MGTRTETLETKIASHDDANLIGQIAAELKIVIDTDAASALFGERFPSFWQSYVINDFQGIQIASSDSKGRIVKPDFFVQAICYNMLKKKEKIKIMFMRWCMNTL